MSKPVDEIIEVAKWGVSVSIDSSMPTCDIVEIAKWTNSKKSKLILRNASRKPLDDLIEIAKWTKENSIFEF